MFEANFGSESLSFWGGRGANNIAFQVYIFEGNGINKCVFWKKNILIAEIPAEFQSKHQAHNQPLSSQQMGIILTLSRRHLRLTLFTSFICNLFRAKIVIEGTPAAPRKQVN